MNAGLLLVVCVLASYRLARLVAVDAVFDRPRQWLARRAGRVLEPLAYGIACPHCVGVWLSALVVAAVWTVDGLPLPALWFPAVAGGQSILASLDGKLTDRG